jgi:hypothetical protein
LQARAAQPIHGVRRNVRRQPGGYGDSTRVVSVGTYLADAAHHHFVDIGRAHMGPYQSLADRDAAQLMGRNVFQNTAVRPDRSTRAVKNQDLLCVTHPNILGAQLTRTELLSL